MAREPADLVSRYDAQRDGLWTASVTGRIEGSIAIDGSRAGEADAHLRWFIVSDVLRGQGIGSRQIGEALALCRRCGLPRVTHWTFAGPDAARHLFERSGFRLVEERHGIQWGTAVTDVLTGPEAQGLAEPALQSRAGQANVFARFAPDQKARVLTALKARGHVVGFLGDGINDASSLHVADAGISVDVAKAAAGLILMEQDLGVLREGVREGRRTFANVLKYIMMGTSSNFGTMFSMAGATLLLPFLPMLPIQVLPNNLLYGISELAIPFDSVDESVLARPSAWDIGYVRRSMLTFGLVSSVFDFLTFGVLLTLFAAIVLVCLAAAETVKRLLYRHLGGETAEVRG